MKGRFYYEQSYFTKICYNLDEYIEFVDNLTDDDIKTKLISVIE